MSFVLFLLSSLSRLSSVSVVFDLNASLNDDAPLPLMVFPVCGFVYMANIFFGYCHLYVPFELTS